MIGCQVNRCCDRCNANQGERHDDMMLKQDRRSELWPLDLKCFHVYSSCPRDTYYYIRILAVPVIRPSYISLLDGLTPVPSPVWMPSPVWDLSGWDGTHPPSAHRALSRPTLLLRECLGRLGPARGACVRAPLVGQPPQVLVGGGAGVDCGLSKYVS